MSIPESAEFETGPWLGVSLTRQSVASLLTEFLRESGSNATVTVTGNDVRIDGTAPALALRTVAPSGVDRRDLRVRVRYTLAQDVGYSQRGSTAEVLLVAMPDGSTVISSVNSADLLGSPPPGISIQDAGAALDVLAQTLQLA